jgi:hypothetical protein
MSDVLKIRRGVMRLENGQSRKLQLKKKSKLTKQLISFALLTGAVFTPLFCLPA